MSFVVRWIGSNVGAALVVTTVLAHGSDVGIVPGRNGEALAKRLRLELEQMDISTVDEVTLRATGNESLLVGVSEVSIDVFEVQSDGTVKEPAVALGHVDPLRAAETLRALLLSRAATESAPSNPTSSVPSPAVPAPVVPPPGVVRTGTGPGSRAVRPRESVRFEASLMGGVSLGATSPGAGAAVAFAVHPAAWRWGPVSMGVGLVGTMDLLPGTVKAKGSTATASLRTGNIGAETDARLEFGNGVGASAALGVFATYMRVSGAAEPPLLGRTDAGWTWSPTTRLRLDRAFGPIRPFVEARVGVAASRVTVRFAEQPADSWGAPWALLGLGVSAPFGP
jgi:hypothetical protein